jgi:hypothetical protein
MKNFIVYTTVKGVILRTGRCQDNMFDFQSGTGESVLEGHAKTDGSQKISGGIVIATPGWIPPVAPAAPDLSVSLDSLGDLATKDSVDLSTSEVTNKSLANLDSTASTKLATIADGADVTADNTAAAITGQGTLATKSAVDLSTSEVTNKSLVNLDSTAATKLSGIEAGADVTVTSTAYLELEARVSALEGSW